MQSNMFRILCFLLPLALACCSIEPVASGDWQVTIDLADTNRQETWSIDGDGQIAIQRQSVTVTTAVELAGSRLSWTLDGVDSGLGMPANFSGTVNGDSLAGTLYAQAGNFTVRGERIRD